SAIGRSLGRLLATLDRFLLVRVAAEDAGVRELAQLVADHVLGAEHLEERAAVVHLERVADELGHDRAGAGPRLDRSALAALRELLHLAEELLVDVRAFLQ